jgi:hypothetical protein
VLFATLTLLVSRRRSKIAKWISIALFVLGTALFVFDITIRGLLDTFWLAVLVSVCQVVAYGLLFTPSAREDKLLEVSLIGDDKRPCGRQSGLTLAPTRPHLHPTKQLMRTSWNLQTSQPARSTGRMFQLSSNPVKPAPPKLGLAITLRLSPTRGFRADHWCAKGHIDYVISGSLVIEYEDKTRTALSEGMNWHAPDDARPPHRVLCEAGATVFIVEHPRQQAAYLTIDRRAVFRLRVQ